jgi:hypothetical protein
LVICVAAKRVEEGEGLADDRDAQVTRREVVGCIRPVSFDEQMQEQGN